MFKERKRVYVGLVILSLFICATLFSAGAEAARVQVKFASWQWEESGFGDFFKEVKAAFEKENPNIEIVMYSVPFPQFADKMLVELRAKTPADIIQTRSDNIHQFTAMGVLDPLDKWLAITKIRDTFYAPQRDFATINGKTYGVLIMCRTLALLYNKELLSKAGVSVPTTPEEFFKAAQTLTVDENKDGTPDRFGFACMTTAEKGMYEDILMWVVGYGGHFAVKGKPTANDPRTIKGVEMYKRIFDANVIPKGVPMAVFRQWFWEGKVAMLFDGPWIHSFIKARAPDFLPKFGVAPTPFEIKGAAIGGGNNFLSIPKDAKHKEEAFQFIKFLASSTWQKRYPELTKAIPGMQGAISENFLQENPWFQIFLDEMKVVRQIPPPGLEIYSEEFQKIVANHVEKTLYKGAPVRQTMDELQKALEEFIAKKRRS